MNLENISDDRTINWIVQKFDILNLKNPQKRI